MKNIIDAIYTSFENTKLHSGLSVRECVAVDNREDPSSSQYADIVDFESWADIPNSQMSFFGTHGVLIHGGIDGCLFHLPAALVHVTKNINELSQYDTVIWDILNSILFKLENIEIQERLSKAQKKAIIDCLEYINNHGDKCLDYEDDIYKLCTQLRIS